MGFYGLREAVKHPIIPDINNIIIIILPQKIIHIKHTFKQKHIP